MAYKAIHVVLSRETSLGVFPTFKSAEECIRKHRAEYVGRSKVNFEVYKGDSCTIYSFGSNDSFYRIIGDI